MRVTLADVSPELCAEWSERNFPLKPTDVTSGSNRKVWWKGACGHEWEAIVKNRVYNHGCPFCSGNRLLTGFNDLAHKRPDICAEWSDRNLPLTPDEVLKRSPKYVWWKCRECGHEWKARIADRSEGHGCPSCSKYGRLIAGENDLKSLYPKIANEWSNRNLPLKPDEVKPLSQKMAWWHCSVCGKEWIAKIKSRIRGLAGCPNCRKHRALVRNAKIDPVTVFLYYAEQSGTEVRKNDESQIGVSMDAYLPLYHAAIIYTGRKQKTLEYKREAAVNNLCRRNGVLLIRIIDSEAVEHDDCLCITRLDDTDEALELTIAHIFQWLCISVEIDIARDKEEIIRYAEAHMIENGLRNGITEQRKESSVVI